MNLHALRRVSTGLKFLSVIAACTLSGSAEGEWLSGADTWAGRKALPAVVNPAVASPLQSVLSLRGEWEFITHGSAPLRHPFWQSFYAQAWPDSRTLQVPGCWEAQGVGDPGPSATWDCKWDQSPREMRHVYMGDAWYRKRVDVPTAWQGKRIWLKVGGVPRRAGSGSTPNQRLGSTATATAAPISTTSPISSSPAPRQPWSPRSTTPSPAVRARWSAATVSAASTATWSSKPPPDARIDDAWVRGDFDRQAAEIHATVAFATGAGRLKNPTLRVAIAPADKAQTAIANQQAPVVFADGKQEAEVVIRVPLNPFRPWSPEHPDLYVAHLTLCDGDAPCTAGPSASAFAESKSAATASS